MRSAAWAASWAPLVMGAVHSAKGSYSIGFMLLSDLALAGCVYAYVRMRTVRPSAAGDMAGGGGVRVGGSGPGSPVRGGGV